MPDDAGDSPQHHHRRLLLNGRETYQAAVHQPCGIPQTNNHLSTPVYKTNLSSFAFLPAITTATTLEQPDGRQPARRHGPAPSPRRREDLATVGLGLPASPGATAAFPLGSQGDICGGQVASLPIRPAILGSARGVGSGHPRVQQDRRGLAGVYVGGKARLYITCTINAI